MGLSSKLVIFLIASSPFFELRGAVPLGLSKGLPWGEVVLLSLLGNIGVILPLLFFFRWVIYQGEKIKVFNKLFTWWFSRVEKRSYLINRYGFWGLVLFVSLPLPGSGAWSGSLLAVLLEMDTVKSFFAITLGVIFACIIVTFTSLGIFFFIH